MFSYAICEINGKQVKIVPNKEIKVDLLNNLKDLEANVLLLSEGDRLSIGKPYLKEKLSLTKLGEVRSDKIRVSKFHAKANYRRVKGSRSTKTRVILNVKK